LDEALAEEADLVWAGGFRYASFLEDARPLGLMLEEEAYRVLSADVVLGDGGREGRVILVLPALGRGEQPGCADPRSDGRGRGSAVHRALSAQVMQADCRLDAVIGRLTLPLRQIMALQVGETLHPADRRAGYGVAGNAGGAACRSRPAGPAPGHARLEAERGDVTARTPASGLLRPLLHRPCPEDAPPDLRAAG
jgi:hypothetical protein